MANIDYQDEMFDDKYWTRAAKWFVGFGLLYAVLFALGVLVVCYQIIHS